MLALELVMRWTHILAAIALAGGTTFRLFALIPAMEELAPEQRSQLGAALRSRWSKVVMASSGLLLLSGLVNFMMIVTRFDIPKTAFPGSLYHMLFGIKFLLALVVFVLAALLTGRTSTAERLRRNERFWLTLNMILAIILVCLGGVLKLADRRPKNSPVSYLSVMDKEKSINAILLPRLSQAQGGATRLACSGSTLSHDLAGDSHG